MTEQNTEEIATSHSEADSAPDPATGTDSASEAVVEPSGTENDTFPRAYVEELRRENAEARMKAKRVDALTQQAVTAYVEAMGRLADPTDLPMSPDLLDDDGLPDRAKVLAAVDDLLTRKPHLASTRVSGDVGQGVRGDVEPMVSLAELLRSGAG